MTQAPSVYRSWLADEGEAWEDSPDGWPRPSGLTSGTRYTVIIHVIGTTSSGKWVEDWTPLFGQVTAC